MNPCEWRHNVGSCTPLYVFDTCTVNLQRYGDEVIVKFWMLKARATFLWTIIRGNTRTHIVDEIYEEETRKMDCTLRSSDLNPIEHAWDGLRAISQRNHPPRKLKVALSEDWA
ncbi:hypothetical protein TNCV_4509561 [Trichonephila clavipes]|nr:hypothetical protein TNCV_4509561 [Trichonephila clavipes]